MNLIIIEDQKEHFEKIKSTFADWKTLLDYDEVCALIEKSSWEIAEKLKNHILEKDMSKAAHVIIIDLKLNDNPQLGLEILKDVRKLFTTNDEELFIRIPIFCFSEYLRDKKKRLEVLDAAATSIYDKEVLNGDLNSDEIKYLQVSAKSLAINYIGDTRKKSRYDLIIDILERLNEKQETHNRQQETHNRLQYAMLELIMYNSQPKNLEEWYRDESNKQLIIQILGGEEKIYNMIEKARSMEILNDFRTILPWPFNAFLLCLEEHFKKPSQTLL